MSKSLDELRKQAAELDAARGTTANRRKVNDEMERNIVTLAAEGYTHKTLGEMFEIHPRTIGSYVKKAKDAANDSTDKSNVA